MVLLHIPLRGMRGLNVYLPLKVAKTRQLEEYTREQRRMIAAFILLVVICLAGAKGDIY